MMSELPRMSEHQANLRRYIHADLEHYIASLERSLDQPGDDYFKVYTCPQDAALAERLRDEWEWLEEATQYGRELALHSEALRETAELLRDVAAALGGAK